MKDLYLNMNTNLMTENIRQDRMCASMCQLDITKDLANKKTVNDNSWFAFGRFEAEPEHYINFLFHIMGMKVPVLGLVYQSLVTVFDEKTGYYYAKDYLNKKSKAVVHEDDFYLKVPNGSMAGNWDNMKIIVDEGEFHLNVEASAIHYPVLMAANSVFDMCNMCIHEFSVPRMRIKGTMTAGGRTYDITDKGFIWFDRQWQNINYVKSTMKWTWISISLDNGEIYSIFDTNLTGWEDNIMAVLCPNGAQINLRHFNPLAAQEKEYWISPKSKQKYPVKWELDIKELDLQLSIVPIKKEQEIVSALGELNKYEGCCTVEGVRDGNPVKGTALVELIGHWKK